MMNLTTMTGFLKKIPHLREDAHRDWLMLLSVTGILLVISIAWNVRFFSSLVEEQGTEEVPGTSLGVYDAESLQRLTEHRAMEAQKYRESYTFVDPS